MVFLATTVRTLLNDFVQTYTGFELNYTTMAEVLLRHQDQVGRFLLGKPSNLLATAKDMVSILPDDNIESVYAYFHKKLKGLAESQWIDLTRHAPLTLPPVVVR